MRARAKRTDSWLGIEEDKIYEVEEYETERGLLRLIIHTDGYLVLNNENDFEIIND